MDNETRKITVYKCKRCGRFLYWDGKKFLDYANLDIVFRIYRNGKIRQISSSNINAHSCGDGKIGICAGLCEIYEEDEQK